MMTGRMMITITACSRASLRSAWHRSSAGATLLFSHTPCVSYTLHISTLCVIYVAHISTPSTPNFAHICTPYSYAVCLMPLNTHTLLQNCTHTHGINLCAKLCPHIPTRCVHKCALSTSVSQIFQSVNMHCINEKLQQ